MLDLLINSTAITKIIALCIVTLTAFFVVVFLGRSIAMFRRLRAVNRRLDMDKTPDGRTLRQIFSSKDDALKHLWTKYSETLHREQQPGNGAQAADTLRSTVPAASVFTTDSIVDAPIWIEFFKHVPGIFTGLGILGTFSGLIRGLQQFDATAAPEAVKASLAGLMAHVSDAFYVSAVAIGLAMVTTTIERGFVTVLYKHVEDITIALDGFFASGVGEDYLARLTRAAERSAADSANLKDALVGELKEILTNLTTQQIEAQNANVRQVGVELARGVTEALKDPLTALAGSAERNRTDNGEAVTKLLTDVLAGFSQKLEELFGGQISGITKLQQGTIDSLGAATEKLTGLVAGIQQASERSGDALNERLLAALKDMEAHQRAANENMSAFVERMRDSADQSQNETTRKLQETLSQIGVAVEAQLAAMREQSERSGAAQAHRDESTSARTEEMLNVLGGRVGEVLAAMREQADRAGDAQSDRDRRAATASEESLARLTAAMEGRLAALGEQGDRSASAASEREAANAARSAELVASVGGRVNQTLGAVSAHVERAAQVQAEREAAAAAQSAEALRLMGARVDETMGALRAHMDRIGETQGQRERQLSDAMAASITNLAGVAQRMMDETRNVAAGVAAAVDAMRGATTTAIDRMNDGSQTIYLAASEFKGAGTAVAGAFKEAEGLSHGLRQSAGSVQEATASLERVVADHAATRQSLSDMIVQMNGIVENARREAGATSDLVAKIEAASQGLARAEVEAERYLAGVTEVLTKVHESYNASLTNALQVQYKEYLGNFTKVSGLLGQAVEDLKEVLQPGVRRAAE